VDMLQQTVLRAGKKTQGKHTLPLHAHIHNTHTYIYTHTLTHICTCIHPKHAHTHTHTYTYTHICTHARIFTRTFSSVLDFLCTEEHIQELNFSRRVLEHTVDSTIEAALSTIDTLFVARESEVAVTPTSLMHSSWEPDPEPEPCSMDTWLRAAIPESAAGKASYLMHEFLQTSTHPSSLPGRTPDPSKRTVSESMSPGTSTALPSSGSGTGWKGETGSKRNRIKEKQDQRGTGSGTGWKEKQDQRETGSGTGWKEKRKGRLCY